MKFWRSRTTLALVLTIAALVVPCGAWYIVGSREVQRTVKQIESPPRQFANDTARQLAQRLQDRFQTLLESESNRPFYQYQSLYHDPRGASEGPSVTPSPLAQGPTDPLIRAYFQIDPARRVTLPTLPETDVEGANLRQIAAQRAIQSDLQVAAQGSACVAFLQKTLPHQHVEVMEADAWIQNALAARIYSDIKFGTNSGATFADDGFRLKDGQREVSIGIGDFQWCSLPTSNGTSLVALRNVSTPVGILVQGFVISNEAVAETLKNAVLPARFTPNGTPGSYVAVARLENTGWFIVVSAAKEFAAADAQARHNWVSFLQLFWAGAGAASVAGLCVVALVWNTERLARQRSQFAASAAHELRTPLAGLRMYSEMLADGLGDPTRTRDYANRVAEEAARLGRVVSNVLGFARLERGALNVRPVPGNLATVVRECVERQRPALEAARASVEFSVVEEVPGVKFDRDAVAEIIQNLLDNAEKYTRTAKNRSIKVSLSSMHVGETEFAFGQKFFRALSSKAAITAKDYAIIFVRDHGPGIPKEAQKRLFRPFARGNRNDSPAGLGLGLVLVKALAKAHGGFVSYYTESDGGAVFMVGLRR